MKRKHIVTRDNTAQALVVVWWGGICDLYVAHDGLWLSQTLCPLQVFTREEYRQKYPANKYPLPRKGRKAFLTV